MSYLNLKGFNNIFDSTLNNELQDNIIEFFDWALLEKGNYFNVTIGELSPNNSDYSLLRESSNQNFTDYKCWEGFRKNWVWQSGVSHNPTPMVGTNHAIPGISGVYVNNVFYPSSSSGTYAHKVDYYNGRIIFNNPIPTGSKVQAEYSYKYINMLYSSSVPWLREVQYRTLDYSASFLQKDKGEFDVPAEMRIQLPAIAVEIVPRRTMAGYQLGGGQYVYTDILFHCMAEDESTRNKLVDIISLQNEKTIFMFDSNSIASSGDFPLDYMGVPVSGALRYPDLIAKHRNGKIRFKDMTVQGMEMINSNFYAGIVRTTTEIILNKI
jgi:hypothetical protein